MFEGVRRARRILKGFKRVRDSNFEQWKESAIQIATQSDTYRGDEELRAVGVRAAVSHRQHAWLGVLQLEVLVLELGAVDRLAAGAVVVGEVATLQHEARNHTVERAALKAEAFLLRAQSAEVLGRLRHDIRAELVEEEEERMRLVVVFGKMIWSDLK